MGRPNLDYGEDTISTCKVVHHGDGRMSIQWRIRLQNGRVERHVTEMKTTRESDLRRKAKATASSILAGAGKGPWKPSSPMSEYVERESIAAVQRNEFRKPLRENTILRYVHVLQLFAQLTHGFPIADSVRPRMLRDVFAKMARTNGTATARQASKVVSKYVMRRLVADGVIDHDPLRDLDLELPEHVAKSKPRGGRALAPEERERAVDFLLGYEPELTIEPGRGRYSPEQRAAVLGRAVDVTLIQAVTGLRIGEVCRLTREDVDEGSDPLTLTVREEVSKTHRGRVVPVIDPRVAERIRLRLATLPQTDSTLLYGSPANPDRVWDPSNRQKAIRKLYRKLSDLLDIPLLSEVSSHVWRTTLNTEWAMLGVPDSLRSAFFGHSVEVNRSFYTDTSSTEQLVRLLAKGASNPVGNPVAYSGQTGVSDGHTGAISNVHLRR